MRKRSLNKQFLSLSTVLLLGLLITLVILTAAIWLQPNSFRDMITRLLTQPLLLLLNLLPVGLMVFAFSGLFRNVCWGGSLAALLLCGTSLASRIKIETRYEAVIPRDFLLLREVGSALESYDISFPWLQIAVVLLLPLALFVAGFFLKLRAPVHPHRFLRPGSFLGSIALLSLLTLTVYASDDLYFSFDTSNYYNHITTYNEYGFPYSFFHHFTAYSVDKPEDYSRAEAESWSKETAVSGQGKDVHMIIVMNEAFSDLTDHPSFSYTEENDPLKTFHSLCADPHTISGHTVVPSIGGGTANTEFDVLTGIQSNALSATTTVALGAVSQNTDSMFRILAKEGYATSFIHPSVGWFYNRENSYEKLGCETQIYEDDLEKAERKGSWITDAYLASYIENTFEETVAEGELMFSYITTFQNHMSYTADKYGEGYEYPKAETTLQLSPEAETALSIYIDGLRDADAMLKVLKDYFSASEEPVLLVFFGDHLPSLSSGNGVYGELGITIDSSSTLPQEYYYAYSTPYLIWANDTAAETLDWEQTVRDLALPENGHISACYLGAMLLELTGHSEDSPWFSYLNELRRELPVVRNGSYMTAEGTLTFSPTETQEKLISKWRNWSYYKLREEEIG